MPGNVQATGSLIDTYPFTTFRSFQTVHLRETAVAEFADGSSQRRNKASNMKRMWSVSHNLTSEQAATLKTFWLAHLIAGFNFKDITNDVVYKAVFTGGFQSTRKVGDRYEVALNIQEIA